MLKGKKILVGVTGSIAAYKAATLIRLLVKQGAQVKVIMSDGAQDFITPLTLSTLSKNPVYHKFILNDAGEWTNHVELALWADCLLIAPATANTIAKMAHGLCDNLLLATYLSAKCVTYVAPAMDLDMFAHASTQHNLATLKSYGNMVLPVAHGELASGLIGAGRMIEPEEICTYLQTHLASTQILKNKKVLVTAGPTYENIDPVRFIGNHSSGKMGFAIADEFARNGADVTLITGPTDLVTNNKNITRIDVTSADEMYQHTLKCFTKSTIAVMSAAVADYTPEKVSISKIKKSGDELHLKLKKTKDILAELGQQKTKKQILVGFALETNNELENAKQKLVKKNLDFIVLNSLRTKGAGFGFDTNKVTIIDKLGKKTDFKLKSKTEVAHDIVQKIIEIKHA
ncbi:MAG: bifunctional phosphopantothenoylcysteine decarboxylase/phosphopantothenate--cysteine ligase CoaBC [Bacteroidia bacterium]|nr:bifunctional phosphopantothenoylcysteine decarboxylase/phosphopantothenate--cysteine ligase CoaBC [Bacteroidia bacterium]MBP9689754.1 bifunctional phosphopantothenoylcysteine decarboxylase/phosphopantothenate--cysteine ligase CoaBC [Bacteroidia bacterium]